MFNGFDGQHNNFNKVAKVLRARVKTRNKRGDNDELLWDNEGERIAMRYFEEEEMEAPSHVLAKKVHAR